MTKEELLKELAGNTWVMILTSPIEGIGVFALLDIPKGCRSMFSKANKQEQWMPITKTEVEKLPMEENY